jgi:hypothetical protein
MGSRGKVCRGIEYTSLNERLAEYDWFLAQAHEYDQIHEELNSSDHNSAAYKTNRTFAISQPCRNRECTHCKVVE